MSQEEGSVGYSFSVKIGGFMGSRKLRIPSFRDEMNPMDYASSQQMDTEEQFTTVVVARWGRVRGFTFRAGDRLVLSSDASEEGLLLLRPRGYGWPMLGRREGSRLVAEPGGVRATPRRWRVAASVMGVERTLARSVTDRGRWHVVVAPRAATEVDVLQAAGLTGGWLSNRAVDALCHRSARFMAQGRGSLAIGVSAMEDEAHRLAMDCPAGRVRTGTNVPSAVAEVVVGPWVPAVEEAANECSMNATELDGVRYDRGASLALAEPRSADQLSLFNRCRSHRAS